MKIKPADVSAFLRKPPATCRVFLIFGADVGLVKLQRDALLKGLGVIADDPFSTTILEQHSILSEPSMLYDALTAQSLMGDAPCVIIRDASNKLTDSVKDIAAHATAYNYLILLAGDLEASGSLRKLCEDAKQTSIATIACYREEGKDLAVTIRTTLQAAGVRADNDAIQLLTTLLGNDRAITQSELDKILLYLGGEKHLTADIVEQCCADNHHAMVSSAVLSWFAGNMTAFLNTTEQLLRSGESVIGLLRIVQYQLVQLISMAEKCASGMNAADVVSNHRPFIHFREKPLYTAILQRWKSPHALLALQPAILSLEEQAKRTGIDTFMLLHQLMMLGAKK
jgi:DNA polymerase-3 subunit delta